MTKETTVMVIAESRCHGLTVLSYRHAICCIILSTIYLSPKFSLVNSSGKVIENPPYASSTPQNLPMSNDFGVIGL